MSQNIIMNNKPMLQVLSDDELEMVIGAGNTTINLNITIIQNYYSIVYAPVYVYGTISNSNVNSGDTYIQNSHVKYHRY